MVIGMPRFSRKSKDKLKTCHKELQILFNLAIEYWDCIIIQGHRGREEQNKYFADGKSKLRYPGSKHNKVPSLAVDVMPYHSKEPHIRWDDKLDLIKFSCYIKGLANGLGIKIKWGGDFNSFFDGPHWQLED
jgi:peptidoglycan L-alanyl-D-glutamate endopeptidase CwlK